MLLVFNFKLFQLKQNKGWTVVGKDFIGGRSEMAVSCSWSFKFSCLGLKCFPLMWLQFKGACEYQDCSPVTSECTKKDQVADFSAWSGAQYIPMIFIRLEVRQSTDIYIRIKCNYKLVNSWKEKKNPQKCYKAVADNVLSFLLQTLNILFKELIRKQLPQTDCEEWG